MSIRRITGLVAGTALVVGAAVAFVPAEAASASTTLPCASSAKIVSRSGSGYIEWAGRETRGKLVKFTGHRVTRGVHFYELHRESIKLRFGHNTFRLGGSAFPSNTSLPCFVGIKPEITRARVDFPEPDSPTTATVCPLGTSIVTSCSTFTW